jgi:hypothetical protein
MSTLARQRTQAPAVAGVPTPPSAVDRAKAIADAIAGKVSEGAEAKKSEILETRGAELDAKAQQATQQRATDRSVMSGASAPFAVPFTAPDQKSTREAMMAMTPDQKNAMARIDSQLGNSAIPQDQRSKLQKIKADYMRSLSMGGDPVDLNTLADEVLGVRKGDRDPDDISRPGDTMPLEMRLAHAEELKKLIASGRMNPEQTRAALAEIKSIENAAQVGIARADVASNDPRTEAMAPALRGLTQSTPSMVANPQAPVAGPVDRPLQEETPEVPRESSGDPVPLPKPVQEEAQKIATNEPLDVIIKEVLTDMEQDPQSPGWNILDLIEAFTKGYVGKGDDTRLRREYAQMIKDKASAQLRNQELQDQEFEVLQRQAEQERGQQFTRERDRTQQQYALELEKMRRPGAELTMGGRPNFAADAAGLFD